MSNYEKTKRENILNLEEEQKPYFNGKQILDKYEQNNGADNFVIPRFQRDYVWNNKGVSKLLYSLYVGIPIGSILIWRNNGKYFVLDGLQRISSIVNIQKNPLKYISIDVIDFQSGSSFLNELKKYFSIERIKKIDSRISSFLSKFTDIESFNKYVDNFQIDFKENKTNFNKKYILLEKNNSHLEELISLEKKLINYIKVIANWIYKDFGEKIKVLTIKIESNDRKYVTRAFEESNANGKKLNKFEVYSARWSNFPIENREVVLNVNSDYVSNKISSEIKKTNSSDRSVQETNKSEVIPSDFIYYLFEKIFKNKSRKKLTPIFYDAGKEKINDIQVMTTLLFYVLKYNSDVRYEDRFEDIGEKLRNLIDNKKEKFKLEDFKRKISNSIDLTERKMSFLRNVKITEDDFTISKLKPSLHLFVSFFALSYKRKNEVKTLNNNHFGKWFLLETLNSSYSAGPGKTAHESIISAKYIDKIDNRLLLNSIINIIDDDGKRNDISNSIKIILAYHQNIFYENSEESIHFDHFIPKSFLNDIGYDSRKIHSFPNIQLLTKTLNTKKSNNFPLKEKYDNLEKEIDSEIIGDYRNIKSDIKNYIDKNYKNDLGEIKKLIDKVLEIRKETLKKMFEKEYS